MERQDWEVLASNLIQDFEGGELELHEIHSRLHQILDRMRAFGIPLPDDLRRLEQELAQQFEADAAEN